MNSKSLTLKKSRAEAFLKGRTIGGRKVSSVKILGDNSRRIYFQGGTSVGMTKKALTSVINRELAIQQRRASLRSMKQLSDGRVKMKMGGLKKGVERIYASANQAAAAVNKRYGKAISPKATSVFPKSRNISAYSGGRPFAPKG